MSSSSSSKDNKDDRLLDGDLKMLLLATITVATIVIREDVTRETFWRNEWIVPNGTIVITSAEICMGNVQR